MRIVQAVDLLAGQPERGLPVENVAPSRRFRSIACPPYRVIYRFDAAGIVIARVWDTRRDPAAFRIPE